MKSWKKNTNRFILFLEIDQDFFWHTQQKFFSKIDSDIFERKSKKNFSNKKFELLLKKKSHRFIKKNQIDSRFFS